MKFRDFFKEMEMIDWILAAVFTALVAFACNSLLPAGGWVIGIVIALILLFVAIRKRGKIMKDQ